MNFHRTKLANSILRIFEESILSSPINRGVRITKIVEQIHFLCTHMERGKIQKIINVNKLWLFYDENVTFLPV